jgi:hypothetical protein
VSPRDNLLFTGDAINFSLDEPPTPEIFERNGNYYMFELQHVTRSYYLMLGEHAEVNGRFERIWVAKVIQLPGNNTSIEPGAGRSERIAEIC